MNIDDTYEFHINKFSPQTFPFGRLGEYIAALAKVFGSEPNVHFSEIVDASVGIVSRVDEVAIGHVWSRIQIAPTMDAPTELAKAYKAVNDMLYADGTSADLKRREIKVLRFAGSEIQKPPKMGPIPQSVEVDGILVRVGGRDKSAHVQIEDSEGRVWNFEVTRDQARSVAMHLFGKPIRIIGTMRWVRDEDGIWQPVPQSAKASEFIPLSDKALREVVQDLRAAYAKDNKRELKPLTFLQHIRGEDDELH